MLIGIGAILAILVLFFALRSKKPMRCFLASTAGGAGVFCAANLAAGLTGVGLSFNAVTVFSAVFLGAPGMSALWLLKYLWR